MMTASFLLTDSALSQLNEVNIMTFCMKWGAEIPEGAAFCPKCGAQVSAKASVEKKDYSGTGGMLILIGGILSIIFSIIPILMGGFWGMFGIAGMRGGMPGLWESWLSEL